MEAIALDGQTLTAEGMAQFWDKLAILGGYSEWGGLLLKRSLFLL